jgi:hypothetical protein
LTSINNLGMAQAGHGTSNYLNNNAQHTHSSHSMPDASCGLLDGFIPDKADNKK